MLPAESSCLSVCLSVCLWGVPVLRAEVNPDGSLSYQIPIEIPPGRIGMQPSLALNYHSQSGNGIAGVGWSLSGLPLIQRIPYDRGVNYDENDTFAGPTGRLVRISDTEYRDLHGNLARYEPRSGCPGGPCGWIVYQPGGIKMVFEPITHSPEGAALDWPLVRVEDAHGNFYTVEYLATANNGAWMPSQIKYTLGNNTSAYHQLRFEYESRPDPVSGYHGGIRFDMDQRLHAIVTGSVADDQRESIFRQYVLEYEESAMTGRGVLKKIHLTDQDGTEMDAAHAWYEFETHTGKNGFAHQRWNGTLPPGAFTGDFNGDGLTDLAEIKDGQTNIFWSNGAEGFVKHTTITGLSQQKMGSDADNMGLLTGDFNGDGRMDLAGMYQGGNAREAWKTFVYIELSNTDGISSVSQSPFTSQFWVAQTPGVIAQSGGERNDYHVLTGDFNGDGKTDIATLRRAANQMDGWKTGIRLELSTGSGFTPQVWNAALPGHMFNEGAPAQDYKLITGDFNGDGKTDIAAIARSPEQSGWHHQVYVELSTGGGFVSQGWTAGLPARIFEAGETIHDYQILPRDFNGDGLTDLAAVHVSTAESSPWYGNALLELSTGKGFVSRQWTASLPGHMRQGAGTTLDYRVIPVDLNQDGRTDLIAFSKALGDNGWKTNFYVERSSGNSFVSESWPATLPTLWSRCRSLNDAHVYLGDFNGDGALDITSNGCDSSSAATARMELGFSFRPDSMTRIREPLGAMNSFVWSPLSKLSAALLFSTDPPCHADAVFCQQTRPNASPRWLVTEVQLKDGRLADPVSRQRLDYENRRFLPGTPQTIQDLGFSRRTLTDLITGAILTEDYSQAKDTAGMPLSVRRSSPDGMAEQLMEYGYETQTVSGEIRRILTRSVNSSQNEWHGVDTYDYDTSGRIIRNQQCGGPATEPHETCRQTEIRYTAESGVESPRFGLPEEIRITGGNLLLDAWRREYNSTGDLIKTRRFFCADASSCGWNQGAWQDWSGAGYDSAGMLVSTQDATGQTLQTLTWDARYHAFPVSGTNALGHTWSRSYDIHGQLLEETTPNGRTRQWHYDSWGSPTASQDEAGYLTTIEYRNQGNPKTRHQEIRQWKKAGISPDQPTGAFFYQRMYQDGLGQVFQIRKKAEPDEQGQARDLVSKFNRSFDAATKTWMTQQDEPFLVSASRAPSSETASYSWIQRSDTLGRPVKAGYADNCETIYSWTATGVETGNSGDYFCRPGQTRYTLAGIGQNRITGVEDKQGNKTVYQYDLMDRLIRVVPMGLESQAITLEWDSWGRKRAIHDPAAGTIRWTWNPDGTLASQTDAPGHTITFRYDKLGRIIEKTLPGPKIVTYEYDLNPDGIGRLSRITDDSGSTLWRYDARGSVLSKTVSIKGLVGSQTLRTTRNYLNRPAQVRLPDKSIVKYLWNTGEKLKEIQLDGIPYGRFAQYDDYAPGDNASPYSIQTGVGMATPEATQTTTQGIWLGRVTFSSVPTRGKRWRTISWQTSGGDNDPFVTSIADTGFSYYHNWNVSWDESRHLTDIKWGAQNDDVIVRYGYDKPGNVLNIETPYHVRTFEPDTENSQRLTTGLTTTYVTGETRFPFSARYDQAGNLLEKTMDGERHEYAYDSQNRLIEVKKNGKLVQTNLYNDLGERVRKEVYDQNGGTLTVFYPFPSYEIRQHSLSRDHAVIRYLHRHGGLKLAAVVNHREGRKMKLPAKNPPELVFGPEVYPEARTLFYHHDPLGSTIQVTDEDNDQVEGFLYYPHGEMMTNGQEMNNQVNHLFAGHEYDQETGLYYMKARFYDPKTARFLTPDTIIPDPYRPSAYHRYAWVENDFLNATDPTGHFKVPSFSVNFDKPDWVKDLQHGADQTLQQTFSAFGQGVNQGLNNLAYGVNTFAHTASAGVGNLAQSFGIPANPVDGLNSLRNHVVDAFHGGMHGVHVSVIGLHRNFEQVGMWGTRNPELTATIAGLGGAAVCGSITFDPSIATACAGAAYGFVSAMYEDKGSEEILERTLIYGAIGYVGGSAIVGVIGTSQAPLALSGPYLVYTGVAWLINKPIEKFSRDAYLSPPDRISGNLLEIRRRRDSVVNILRSDRDRLWNLIVP
ncbi:MAG: VCBS repeat-containing protein [SAR324 cluster bacterium]|nr:VCBS repeat-containing protein [SAR324 cluster bacterium]